MGKTLRIFLVDDEPTGLLTAEIMNWTGKIISVPRNQLSELKTREESKKTGIYFLIGPDPEEISGEILYIGESDNVLKRLIEHDASKDDWNRAILVISKDENITKSHGRYLESRFIQLSLNANRVKLLNGTNPQTPALPESDISDMEYFIDQTKLVLPVLGCDVLKPKPKLDELVKIGKDTAWPRFVLEQVGINAEAIEIDNEFLVLKGSFARKKGVPSWDSYFKLREQLVSEGKMIDSDQEDKYIFVEDTPFSSPSAAGACVLASNTNGRTSWKLKETGQSYEAWSRQKLELI